MPWKESDAMSERTKFVARLLDGERMSDLCREFGISRKTGYKLKERYCDQGPQGLYDQSRRPLSSPHRTASAIVERVVELRRRFPTWGPKKLRAKLVELEPESRWPAASTIGVIIKDAGLVDGRKRKRRAWPTPPSEQHDSVAANDLWAMDFKGQFRLGDGRYCYPLTVSDHYSRFLLGCEALENTKTDPAGHALETVFREYGLPKRIRSDNGAPFASTGLGGLTMLSAWLMRLGIRHERIEPGKPQQNGRHERIHLTLKQETTRPAAANMLLQQQRFDEFVAQYNDERPHEALAMKPPASAYKTSQRRLPVTLPAVSYPLHDVIKRVSQGGHVRLEKRDIFVSKALRGQPIGLRQLDSPTWLLSFMDLDLAYLDLDQRSVVPIPS